MADELKFSEGIVKEDRGYLYPGGFKIDHSGIVFKSRKTGVVEVVKKDDLVQVVWQRIGCEEGLRVTTVDGDLYRFGGFNESDFDRIRSYVKNHFDLEVKKKDRALEGWNWGTTKFSGNAMTFRGGKEKNQPIFDVPLKNVRECTLESKNEVSLKFHRNEDLLVPLMELRFHIPTGQEGQEDPVQSFIQSVLAKANVIQATGDAVASFGELRCITPRGSYDVKMFPTFIQLHGKTHNHMLPLTSVLRLFRLPHRDQRQVHFVLSLDPPINQGQTLYPFVIFNFNAEDHMKLELNVQEVKDKFEGKIDEDIEGPTVDLISQVTKLLVQRKVTHPAEGYCGKNQVAVIPCSYRNNQGLLYPLDRGFIWVHKPPVHVRFDEIACINFSRSGGSTRSFDIEIELKREGAFTFSSIEKDEYARLFDFCTNKKLRIKNIGGATATSTKALADDDMIDSDADDDGHDAYLARVKQEGRERDDDEESDEDFNPDKVSGSEGSVAEEFDSDASSSGEQSDEDSSSEKKKKEKKQKKKHRDEESSKKKKKREGKKGKKEKDPDKPKKPMTAYFLWFQEQRDKMKEKYPDLSFTDLAKKGGELWKELKDKSKWENEAKRLQEGYKKDMERYEAGGGGDRTLSKKGDTKKPSTSKKTSSPSTSKKTSSPSKSSSFKSKEFIDSSSSSESEKESKKKKKKNDEESEKESKKKKKNEESEEEKKSKKKGKKKESSEEEEEEEEEAVSTPDSDSD